MEGFIQGHSHSYLNSVLSQADPDHCPLQSTEHTASEESWVTVEHQTLMCCALGHLMLSVLLTVVFAILLCE